MVGNPIFYPGQYLFLNPFGLGRSLGFPWQDQSISNIMGLGGYHLVTEVSSEISEDGFVTSLTARFDNSGDGRPRNTEDSDEGPRCEAESPAIPMETQE